MLEPTDDDVPGPLPREWLPVATAPADAMEWTVRLERIVAAAGPTLERLALQHSGGDVPWPTTLGTWWKPAAALAAAAATLLLMLDVPDPRTQPGSLPLSVVAAEGEPVGLWDGLGIDADPVLALIALQERAE